jgi:hypothetical protein
MGKALSLSTRIAAIAVGWVVVWAVSISGGQGLPAIALSLEEAFPADGRPCLLVFFSTDCEVCFDDLLEMNYFVDQKGLAVRVIGISGDTAADIEKFAAKHSLKCPLVRDDRGRIRRRFRVDDVPFKIVLEGGAERYRDDVYRGFDERRRRAEECLLAIDAR